ncbi:TIGR03619 family F420-dependent LLM class oxidoreductase [Solihabitans fulvus]|uniref:TIGR03619 family F420-dependent LLM class oxidoreductase n=1 Tax=Solihabitans fulvus TaxID=1892852 RepID=A0A5B2WZF1_9PSEU|nr:TIGR03619 family F420-dependent LLM class oxidoreductase [Solihabitans fulvus]KAA2256330.1 TIGR03619 family F420-dependent LLM class oxidoreductase [Solihabitans fulvus]
MRIGLAVPQYGPFADPTAVVEVARAAETIGFDSLWVCDRVMAPLHPRDLYPGGDGVMPARYATFLDPLPILTLVASVTTRVRLGTSTLNALWQPPMLLARTLSTLDHISGGRLDVGIGLGWSSDEYQAVGVPWAGRGARLDETLDVLLAAWTGDPVEHTGTLWTVPPSRVWPKPVQRPHPPLLLSGFTPAGLARVGQRADGWLGVALPLLAGTWQAIRGHAELAGRDPDALRMPLRVNPMITDAPVDPELVPHQGTVEQVAEYLLAAAEIGADEVLVDFQQTADSTGELLDLAGAMHAALRS